MVLFPTKFSVSLRPENLGLWECLGNRLINHAHVKESDHLLTLAQEMWDTDQVLFARGLLPRDWLLASELAECSEV